MAGTQTTSPKPKPRISQTGAGQPISSRHSVSAASQAESMNSHGSLNTVRKTRKHPAGSGSPSPKQSAPASVRSSHTSSGPHRVSAWRMGSRRLPMPAQDHTSDLGAGSRSDLGTAPSEVSSERPTMVSAERPSTVDTTNEVVSFLKEAGLQMYAIPLLQKGYEDMEALLSIEDSDMKGVGIPDYHVSRLRKAMNVHCQASEASPSAAAAAPAGASPKALGTLGSSPSPKAAGTISSSTSTSTAGAALVGPLGPGASGTSPKAGAVGSSTSPKGAGGTPSSSAGTGHSATPVAAATTTSASTSASGLSSNFRGTSPSPPRALTPVASAQGGPPSAVAPPTASTVARSSTALAQAAKMAATRSLQLAQAVASRSPSAPAMVLTQQQRQHSTAAPACHSPVSTPVPSSAGAAGNGGGGGGDWQGDIANNPVAKLLESIGMQQYVATLFAHGFDDMESLLLIEDADLKDAGVPRGHALKLKKKLHQYQLDVAAQDDPDPSQPARLSLANLGPTGASNLSNNSSNAASQPTSGGPMLPLGAHANGAPGAHVGNVGGAGGTGGTGGGQHSSALSSLSPASSAVPTEQMRMTVEESWEQVQILGTFSVGELLYKHMFRLAPEAVDLFPAAVRDKYRDWAADEEVDADIWNSPALRRLFAKFVNAIGCTVAGLHDVGKLVPLLMKLGMRHIQYRVPEQYWAVLGTALDLTLQDTLGEAYTGEVKSAWTMVYSFMSSIMVEGLRKAQAAQNQQQHQQQQHQQQQQQQQQKPKQQPQKLQHLSQVPKPRTASSGELANRMVTTSSSSPSSRTTASGASLGEEPRSWSTVPSEDATAETCRVQLARRRQLLQRPRVG